MTWWVVYNMSRLYLNEYNVHIDRISATSKNHEHFFNNVVGSSMNGFVK